MNHLVVLIRVEVLHVVVVKVDQKTSVLLLLLTLYPGVALLIISESDTPRDEPAPPDGGVPLGFLSLLESAGGGALGDPDGG